ncbi:MAG: hypothetical protein ACK53Y_05775 [bacterium]
MTKKNVAEEFDAIKANLKIIRGVGGVGRSVVLWLDTCRVLGAERDTARTAGCSEAPLHP